MVEYPWQKQSENVENIRRLNILDKLVNTVELIIFLFTND